MKLFSSIIFFSSLLFSGVKLHAQKADTLQVTAADINTDVLREGTHRYLIYFKMKKDSVRTQTQFWTRTIRRKNYKNRSAVEINQEWEDKDSIMHQVKSIAEAKTMEPLYHRSWWKVQTARNSPVKSIMVATVDFLDKTVNYNGKPLSDTSTNKQEKAIWAGYQSSLGKYFLNWHSDLETFPTLPYKIGLTFVVPFYDPGTASGYQQVAYTVTGSAGLAGFDNQKIDCWVMVHETKGNKEIYWISKKTKEVLKLEQEINGTIYRYKIKLGFSL